MASIGIDKRTGNMIVRAYGGINPDTGKIYQPCEVVSKGSSEAEIQEAVHRVEALADAAKGNTTTMTIGTLVTYYLDGCDLQGMSPTTLSSYRSYSRRHVQPRIGSVRLAKADASTFSTFYRSLLRPKADGGAGLSVATVEKIHAFLSGCFTRLAFDGVIKRNPISGVKPPRGKTKEAKALVPADLSKLRTGIAEDLDKTFDDDAGFEAYMHAVCWWVDLHSGERRGELSGAQRKHVVAQDDSDDLTLRVARVIVQIKTEDGHELIAKEPKSKKGIRPIALDTDTSDMLRIYLDVQESVLMEHRVEVTGETPLFCHVDGTIFTPAQLTDSFKATAMRFGLPPWVHLHSLRHTHATYLLEAGENIRVVQERLGHASVNTTLNLYGHVLPGRDGEAARAFAATAKSVSAHHDKARKPVYAPKCPLSGETCARFKDLE